MTYIKNHKRKINLILLILTGLFAIMPKQAFCVNANYSNTVKYGRVVIIVADRLNLNDWQNSSTPEMHTLLSMGAIGLMTTNSASGYPRHPDHAYATMGAGAKISGGSDGSMAFNSSEKLENDTAGDVFFRNTGIKKDANRIVHLGIVSMINSNARLKYHGIAGALGEILHANGLKTVVLGNADLPNAREFKMKYARQAVNIAMDAKGTVDYGDVSGLCYKQDNQFAAGVSTNYRHLADVFDKYSSKGNLFVIETGDLSRLEQLKDLTTAGSYQKQRSNALQKIDNFIEDISSKLNFNRDLLIMVSPDASLKDIKDNNTLTPVIMYGKGIKKGLLTSGTTKRPGLITNTDIAVTVAEFFGFAPEVKVGEKEIIPLYGRKIDSEYVENQVDNLKKLNNEAIFLAKSRYPLVKVFINSALVILIVSIVLLLSGQRRNKIIKFLLLALTFIPMVLLVIGKLSDMIIGGSIIIAGIIALFAVMLLTFIAEKTNVKKSQQMLNPFIFCTSLTSIILLADIWNGSQLLKTSPFSYDLMAGARFYGIGNELMGVLLGSVIALAGLLLDKQALLTNIESFLLTLFIFVTYVIASPSLGANAGGGIAAVAAFSASVLILFNIKINRRSIMICSVASIMILASFVLYDSGRLVEAQTHVGRSVSMIKNGGFGEIINIISRKLEVNLKLIKYTTWSWFYFLSLTMLVFLKKLVPDKHYSFISRNPIFSKMIKAVVTGSIFALVFNDSGVVAASTMILYVICPYLYGLSNEVNNNPE